jgi:transcriptional regulator with XRE-family HTH domain
MTQEDIADICKIPKTYWVDAEQGTYNLNTRHLARISLYLDTEASNIFAHYYRKVKVIEDAGILVVCEDEPPANGVEIPWDELVLTMFSREELVESLEGAPRRGKRPWLSAAQMKEKEAMDAGKKLEQTVTEFAEA